MDPAGERGLNPRAVMTGDEIAEATVEPLEPSAAVEESSPVSGLSPQARSRIAPTNELRMLRSYQHALRAIEPSVTIRR